MLNHLLAKPVSFKLSFSGHETFPFRLGWIRKGVAALEKDREIFTAEDAVVRLGVGKNMVRSIKTWCLATQMIEELTSPSGSRTKTLAPSELARVVFSEQGDPYLEDPGSLWLLHWLLVTNSDKLSLWRLAFMNSRENEFTKSDLVQLAVNEVQKQGLKIEMNSISRDVDVFIRTYTSGKSTVSEEDFSCPLTELGLVSHGGSDRYTFIVGSKRTLPSEIFGFAFAQFTSRLERSECSLSDATYNPGSPGQAFRLDEDSVVAHFRSLDELHPGRWLVDVDGPIRRIGALKPLNPIELLSDYYQRSSI